MKNIFLFTFLYISSLTMLQAQKPELGGPRTRWGLEIGVLPIGKWNAITDVPGVKVGHTTIREGMRVQTGVTAIIPHDGSIFQEKVPAAVFIGNGFGKLAGYTQIKELGNLETPIILTNTLAVPVASQALIEYTLNRPENKEVRSVNPVVGETNDGFLNDIRSQSVQISDVLVAIQTAKTGEVLQGNVGAGTGTVCFGWKGGIGTSSRQLPASLGGYHVGVLVQTNFGGVLHVAGKNIGKELGRYYLSDKLNDPTDGSCMIVVATDAPLSSRNLERLASRAMFGLAKTGGIASNGSGDYVIAFSTAQELRIKNNNPNRLQAANELTNEAVSPLFLAVIEATEEAILNSLFHAQTTEGHQGKVEALPLEKVKNLLQKPLLNSN